MTFDDRFFNGLGVLAAVVRNGNFAAAGKSLNMSQSGVSRAIARLEARLGARLLERTTRTVRLSEEGRRLYEQIAPLLSGLEEAAASVATSKMPFAELCGLIWTRSSRSLCLGRN
jgi:DNA-binding transcriptional LysR family regulator